ncbi:MAG: autotransporter-associated beta strand repeat-containing protein, partial [Alphaproteobacteria bacterium]|nr:autotransporter-associated beta strand repeat-containing protein [Alphaproteobacteria bacterium]
GTLTINGDLTLNANSSLFYNLQQAGVAGGQLNDLTVVTGKLDLAGTINLAYNGEPLGPGVYRLFDYGTLSCGGQTCDGSNGLKIGDYLTVPTSPQDSATVVGPMNTKPTDFLVQLSVAGQVNLVSTGGINVNYWDAPPKVSNTVSGGTGTWVADGSNTNWTDAKGQINASWSPGEFAIFMANPGTVTVSNAGGDVTAQGMQFAVGGYEVTGDPITLVNTANTSYSVIRVGDGTAASAAMTATISAALQGDAGLVKEDYGTLVLSGTNLYTGGTYLMNGTLQIASDANLGSAGMNLRIANNSTLATTESFTMSRPIVLMGTADNPVGGIIDTKAGTTLTVSGVISDITFAGSLTKAGDGTLVLTNENFYTGGTTIAAGTLALGNGGTSGSILGDVVNSATLSFNRSDSVIFGGIISGSGALEQNGSGTTILTADNSYSGGTTIQSGTLALGNGATSGSISGDVTNGGTLAFNRTDLVTFNGVISDCTIATCGTVSAGSVVQKGSGTTILTADNTYSGTTTIQSGWLYINGDQSAATGVLTAQAGTRLGGSGTLGGNVLMAAGSTLAPGAAPTLPGTLTINGDLTLNANSSLFYNLGQAGVAGGPLNDLTVVKGNLDLAGTLNLAYNGEPLEPGVYRLFDYGSLSCGGAACTGSNGLAIGDYLTAPTSPQGTANVVAPLNDPANPAFSVQTSIAGQVNLVNTGGLSLNYWDGENGGKNDSQITGGDGKWSVGSGAPDNWTNSGGSANAPWTKGFAIFTGTGGTVAVDNSGGAVTTQGMQFAVDGYRVVANSPGDVLTLENTGSTPYSVIRVGDGTAESANMTAVIDVPLVGAAGLVKEDYGTLVLSGTNLYSGGTYLMNGTLQIASDANLGSAGMNLRIANNSTLATTDSFTMSRPIVLMGTADNPVGGIIDTRAGTTLTVSGVISDITFAATLTKAGDGTLVLTNDNLYTGGTVIAAGTLQLGSGGTSGSILGDVANSATLSFNRSDAVIFAGTISGSGALLQNGSGTTILTADNTYSGGTTIQSGTLQLGNGGTSGSIIGNISNGGTLAFNRADAFTFNGVISDCTIATCGAVSAGSVVQKGSGTTILTADSTYSGGTTIQSGTLQLGNGGTSGSITGDVANNGTLSFNRSGTYIFGGVVSGSGAVVQKGSGTTILTGDSSYSGGTTIATGTLQLGNGGTSGSITGDVVNQGVLSFSRSSDITFAGQVSGAGALSQIGGGTTSLTANSSYSGGTTIQSGTLQLGNGGTSGSITGDVVNNATLGFNHSDLLVLMGTISGAGNMVQSGSGDTALYGDNSYSGTTTVSSGGLYINGSQSGNGLTTVNVGGTLGGTGTLGGPVTVAGTLAPGNVGVLPGTLTINGDLILQSGSTLSYDFGQAYVVGGPLNDLTVVNGNLQLGGTIDVTETLGGSFAAGIYRVIDYSGNLSGSLDRSTRVAGLGLEVQTSVPQQVNLVNTNGLVLNFWDLNPDNSVIDGAGTQGTGDWKLGDSVKNWTDLIGSYNGTFTNGTIAIFTATPGTVMVDNGQGQVKAGGMQFASSGYVVSGQALELVPGDSSSNAAVIRVGDGSSDGALMTATINAALIGSAQLMKTDLGTLVLTGSNSYSGGTAIEGGTLQVGEDANLGAAGTSVDFNGGTLHATAGFSMARNSMLAALGGTMAVDGGAVLEDNGTISGEGALTKSGEGTLVLGSANSYSGGTALNGGTLLLGNANALGSGTLTMAGATVLDFADSYTIANGINLAGIGGINVHDALTTTLAGVIGDGEGAGLLQKTGSGTLVLTGSNSYSGGTAINGGVLEVSQNVNLGASGGAVAFDGGTLHVTAAFAMVRDFVLNAGGAVLDTDAGVVLQNDGALTGAGGLTKTGAGSLALSGPASYSGATVVDQGLLRAVAENVLSPNSAVTVNAAAVLDLGGHSQAVAALTNSGMVTMGANTAAGAVLTVGGNYVGNGGTLMFNTLLAGDNSPSDRMVVAGSASGTSQVSITRAGGLGALTTGNGIELIAVNGVSDPGAFRLQGRVAAGTYEYMLFMGGIGADAGNQNWYLRSELACRRLPRSGECASAPEPIYRPEVMVDSAMAGLASRFGLGMLGTWHERSGGEFGTSYSRVEGANQAAWARLFGNAGNVGGNSGDSSDRAAAFDRHGPSYDYGFAGIQAGMDVWRRDNRDGSRDTAGLYLGAGNARADVNGEVDFGRGSRAGQLTLNGYSFGGYYTHVGRSGWYVDVVAQGTRYDHIRATSNIEDPQTLASGGWGWVVSGEGGTPIHLARGFILEPQAQLVYQHMGFANGSDAFGRINFSDSDALFGRIGARVARDFALADGRKVTAWMRASLWSAFGAQATTTFSSLDGSNPTPVRTDLGGNWSQFDLGLEAQVNRSLAVFANASYNVSFTQGQGWGGRGGVKLSW